MREAEHAEKGIAREMPRKVKNLIFRLGFRVWVLTWQETYKHRTTWGQGCWLLAQWPEQVISCLWALVFLTKAGTEPDTSIGSLAENKIFIAKFYSVIKRIRQYTIIYIWQFSQDYQILHMSVCTLFGTQGFFITNPWMYHIHVSQQIGAALTSGLELENRGLLIMAIFTKQLEK